MKKTPFTQKVVWFMVAFNICLFIHIGLDISTSTANLVSMIVFAVEAFLEATLLIGSAGVVFVYPHILTPRLVLPTTLAVGYQIFYTPSPYFAVVAVMYFTYVAFYHIDQKHLAAKAVEAERK